MTTPQAAPAAGGVDSALAEALSSPEKGKGIFYSASAAGTPLALLSFGVSWMMLSLINADAFSGPALPFIFPVAAGLGSIGLIIAGLWDFRAGNAFAATWEIAYGALWVFVALFVNNIADIIGAAAGPGATPEAAAAAGGAILEAFGAYLFIWAFVTLGFTVGTWFIAKTAFIAFGLTALAFILLGFAYTGDTASSGSQDLVKYAGWVGIIAAAVVLYLAFALILNDHLGRQVLPIFPYGG